jgi:hypothetical protein
LSLGTTRTRILEDDWTVVTTDGQLAEFGQLAGEQIEPVHFNGLALLQFTQEHVCKL